VDADEVDADEVETARRTEALAFGWAEPLGHVRRGLVLVAGAGVVPPDEAGCLILEGLPHEVEPVLLALARDGWSVLSDRYVPCDLVEDRVIAQARAAPVIASARRARGVGLDCRDLAGDTDAAVVLTRRTAGSRPVAAIAAVRPMPAAATGARVVIGPERLECAARLLNGGGIAAGEPDAAGLLRGAARLAGLPQLSLAYSGQTMAVDVGALTSWWRGLPPSPESRP
jgi:hypothetical protein